MLNVKRVYINVYIKIKDKYLKPRTSNLELRTQRTTH
jgi:hypothetical protein